jgi:hypothetical protein
MNQKKKLMPIIGVLLLLAVLSLYVWNRYRPTGQSLILTVNVVYPLNKTPLAGVVVEAVHPSGRVVAKQTTDRQGQLIFRLGAGHYLLRCTAGYAGQDNIDLQSDQTLQLEALPIFQ